MRILFVNNVGDMGGAERSLLELSRALTRFKELDLHATAPAGKLGDALVSASIAFHPLPECRLQRPHGILAFIRVLRKAARASQSLYRQAAAIHPDIIHANSATAALIALPWRAKKPSSLIWHCRDMPEHRFSTLMTARGAHCILAISPPVRRRIIREFPRGGSGKTVLIHNGIDLSRFRNIPGKAASRARLHLPREGVLIGMAAHLAPWKRHDLFLTTFALILKDVPDAYAVIAGKDRFCEHEDLETRLHNLAAGLGITDRVLWLGEISDMVLFFTSLDVLIHPAEEEPFGRVVCEAMASGCPVIAVSGGGPAEIIENGISGMVASRPDAEELAQKTLPLLHDGEMRHRFIRAAHHRVRELFDVDRTAGQVLELYRKLIPPNDSGMHL